MPELPEVETIARQLNSMLVGQKIEAVEIRRNKSWVGQKRQVVGRRIKKVGRRAKIIVVKLDGGVNLLIHLKMTGQLVYRKKGAKGGEISSKHTRVILKLSGGEIFFNDMRVFGWIKVISSSEFKAWASKLPPDVVDSKFNAGYLVGVLMSTRRAVKIAIMDQNKIGGMGNIYANDALWKAKINPEKSANLLKKNEVRELYKSMKEVIRKGVEHGGATARDEHYVNAKGSEGKYQNHFLVYERKGERCKRYGCRGVVKKIKLGGRGTYFCQKCQK